MQNGKSENQTDPFIFSFDKNLENPFSIIYEESFEPQDSEKCYTGANLCGITNFDGSAAPWGRRPIEKNPEFVCIGCSCTVSMGLIEEYSWPSIIREFTGAKVNNLSSPGSGIDFLSSFAIDSFAQFGKPKTVFALFPDIYRMWTVNSCEHISNGKNHTIHASWHTDVCEYFMDVRHSAMATEDKPVTTKPFSYTGYDGRKTTISVDATIFNSFTTLEMLMHYCRMNNMDFKFCSWDDETNKIFSNISYYDSNYQPAKVLHFENKKILKKQLKNSKTNMDQIWWEEEINISDVYQMPWRRLGFGDECEHLPQTEYQKKCWSVASDVGNHPGIHDQIHFAEHFLGMKIDNDFLGKLP